ncbi:MAG: ABC transporter ATP-binding protein, partial [Candidatus Fimadaptatus sp.]
MSERKPIQPRPMGGPGPHGRGPGAKPKNIRASIKRLMGYMGAYKWFLLLVVVLIAASSLAQVMGTSYLRSIVDEYITPMAQQVVTEGSYAADLMSGFVRTLVSMAFVYLFGALSTFIYARLMLRISTGTLLKLRTDLFNHMETLSIKYFDTHAHGDIMSRYTNDVDTIREMMSNSIASFIASGITVVSVFVMMLYYSWLLTLLVIAMMAFMLFVSGKIAGLSSKYFRKQQAALGALNGYIEEMMEGARVVKVFCREAKTQQEFDVLNENMRDAATEANTYGGIMGPVNNNLSHTLYAIVAMVGCVMVINGFTGLTLGTLIAFLQYTRSFSQPVAQISQQFNTVLNALAGAERVFALIDEPSEEDEGYVTLVNVSTGSDGNMVESDKVTGQWAWKHPHTDGSGTEYKPVRGDVVFEDVTF